MISVSYTPSFVRQAKALDSRVFNEAVVKIESFKDRGNHEPLKVHKLHGRLRDLYSFSVNHDVRIIFEYVDKNNVIFHDIGRHTIYE